MALVCYAHQMSAGWIRITSGNIDLAAAIKCRNQERILTPEEAIRQKYSRGLETILQFVKEETNHHSIRGKFILPNLKDFNLKKVDWEGKGKKKIKVNVISKKDLPKKNAPILEAELSKICIQRRNLTNF